MEREFAVAGQLRYLLQRLYPIPTPGPCGEQRGLRPRRRSTEKSKLGKTLRSSRSSTTDKFREMVNPKIDSRKCRIVSMLAPCGRCKSWLPRSAAIESASNSCSASSVSSSLNSRHRARARIGMAWSEASSSASIFASSSHGWSTNSPSIDQFAGRDLPTLLVLARVAVNYGN